MHTFDATEPFSKCNLPCNAMEFSNHNLILFGKAGGLVGRKISRFLFALLQINPRRLFVPLALFV